MSKRNIREWKSVRNLRSLIKHNYISLQLRKTSQENALDQWYIFAMLSSELSNFRFSLICWARKQKKNHFWWNNQRENDTNQCKHNILTHFIHFTLTLRLFSIGLMNFLRTIFIHCDDITKWINYGIKTKTSSKNSSVFNLQLAFDVLVSLAEMLYMMTNFIFSWLLYSVISLNFSSARKFLNIYLFLALLCFAIFSKCHKLVFLSA